MLQCSKHGEVLGSGRFLKLGLKKHNRRQIPTDQSNGFQRKDDRYLQPIEKVLREFKSKKTKMGNGKVNETGNRDKPALNVER
jgi:hypothetical protein